MLPTSLIIIRNRPSKGGYVCPESEFQNLLFHVLRRRPCRYRYFSVLSYLRFSLSLSQFQSIFVSFVAISAALCRCFKDMFCLSRYSPTRPKEGGQNKCNQRRPTEGWSYTKHYCCMGLVGLKSEKKKGSVKIRRYHYCFVCA